MDIRAVDPGTRRPLAPGEVGELAVRGHVTPGYYRAPEHECRRVRCRRLVHDRGSRLVGEDGRVRYRGRLKEMIKTGGINVAPLEVEAVLLQHPDVAAGLRRRSARPAKGEIVAAVIELKPVPRKTRPRWWPGAASGWQATRCRRAWYSGPPNSSRARRQARSTSRGCARSWNRPDGRSGRRAYPIRDRIAAIASSCRS